MAVTVLTNQDFTISAAGMYRFGDVVFEITGKQGGKYSGKVGDKTFRNWDKNGVRMLVGAEYTPRVRNGKGTAAHIPAKVDNSQAHGQHKVLSATQSASKQQKRFLKAYKLCKQASEVYGLTDVFSGMLEQLQKLDNYVTNCEAIKVQHAIELAKAEAEAKAKAEAAAKKLKDAIIALRRIKEDYINCGMSPEQAETFARQHKNYTDEEKAAAFE